MARRGRSSRTTKRRTRVAAAASASAGREPSARQEGLGFPVVGIGASAGGLDALRRLFRAMPTDTGMAFVIIQHLDPTHASMLTEILGRVTSMPVNEVAVGTALQPNHVYVMPPATSMTIAHGALELSPRTEGRGQHRPIDQFLSSLAEDQRHAAVGVILSGSATDGTRGLESIKAEGGITFAQDDSAQHTSMPHSAVAAGCVDYVLAPEEIAQEIGRIGRHPYVRQGGDPARDSNLDRILDHVRGFTGVDFSNYKRNTLHRRINRRAVLYKRESLGDYLRFLQDNPTEAEALYQDILINVTSFFRNSEAFEALKTKVFPRLLRERSPHDPVRIWVLGCSTGEEAYSIAMTFTEVAEESGVRLPLQVFGTDLNGACIDRARSGMYAKSIAQDVTPERLRRFFVETDGHYRITKSIRDLCVFARHNVLTDPPFSRIDLIACRNLLIYLEPVLQQRVMPILHYALKPSGVLWLGPSESVGASRELFEVEDGKQKLYVKRPGAPRGARPILVRDAAQTGAAASSVTPRQDSSPAAVEAQREADRVLLSRYTPPSVLVNAELDILQLRGDTGLYLTPASGRASLNILKMLRDGLLVAVRGALLKAKREDGVVRVDGLRVRTNGGHRQVSIQVVPVRSGPRSETSYLVLFEDPSRPGSARQGMAEAKAPAPARSAGRRDATLRELARTRQELAATREYLQAVIEQQEAANEELQSSNEEVQSANEELQSLNEELETSKEEVQSTNEELGTLNEELHNRNLELSLTNNDIVNLLNSVQMAIVMLGSDLRIRRFTPMAEKLFNLRAGDVGRPIGNLKVSFGITNLEELIAEVIGTMIVKEIEVADRDGHWYSLRIRPYRTTDNHIDGAVLMMVDVDTLKRSQEVLRRHTELLEQTHEPIVMWEMAGSIIYWNRGAEEVYGFSKDQAMGRNVFELLDTQPGADVVRAALEAEGRWSGELTQRRADRVSVVVDSRMVLLQELGRPPLVIETDLPLTERKQMEQALRVRADELLTADRSKNDFIATLAHELRNPLAPLRNLVAVLRAANLDRAAIERACDTMDRQVQNMARLTDGLLDVARMTHGRIQVDRVRRDLVAIVRQAVDLHRPVAEERGQHLLVTLPAEEIHVDADAMRVEQLLGNLLSNASKFTPAGGHVWVSVERQAAAAGSQAEEAVIRVRDDGEGIPAELLPRVFDVFVQGDRTPGRAQGGLGIGLTLVRRLVELHEGSVQALSAGVGEGSEFVIRLPLQPARGSLEEAAPGSASAPAAPPRRILIVDDSMDSAESLAQLLRLQGHEVRTAYDGLAAIDAASAFDPEVVILDIGLPGVDGYETTRRLRQRAGDRRPVIVALTGYGTEADREQARHVGFDYHMTKPTDLARLRAILAANVPRS